MKKRKILAINSSPGILQLPILIGLAIMVLALPVTVKLVQERQDVRESASGGQKSAPNCNEGDGGRVYGECCDCGLAREVRECVSAADNSKYYRTSDCVHNTPSCTDGCESDEDDDGDNEKENQKKTECDPQNEPYRLSYCTKTESDGINWMKIEEWCSTKGVKYTKTGSSTGVLANKPNPGCPSTATKTPTAAPTSAPAAQSCSGLGGQCFLACGSGTTQLGSRGGYGCPGSYYCCQTVSLTPVPTITPTPTPISAVQSCDNLGGQCLPSCISGSKELGIGESVGCPTGNYCCLAVEPTVRPTPIPIALPVSFPYCADDYTLVKETRSEIGTATEYCQYGCRNGACLPVPTEAANAETAERLCAYKGQIYSNLATACVGDNRAEFMICVNGSWKINVCGEGLVCLSGICQAPGFLATTTEEAGCDWDGKTYSLGSKRCFANQSQECRKVAWSGFITEAAYSWQNLAKCGSDQVCLDGECAPLEGRRAADSEVEESCSEVGGTCRFNLLNFGGCRSDEAETGSGSCSGLGNICCVEKQNCAYRSQAYANLETVCLGDNETRFMICVNGDWEVGYCADDLVCRNGTCQGQTSPSLPLAAEKGQEEVTDSDTLVDSGETGCDWDGKTYSLGSKRCFNSRPQECQEVTTVRSWLNREKAYSWQNLAKCGSNQVCFEGECQSEEGLGEEKSAPECSEVGGECKFNLFGIGFCQGGKFLDEGEAWCAKSWSSCCVKWQFYSNSAAYKACQNQPKEAFMIGEDGNCYWCSDYNQVDRVNCDNYQTGDY